MKKLILILTLLLTIGVSGQSEMFGKDKQLHFLAGMVIAGVTYEATKNTVYTLLCTIGTTIIVGVLKELYDMKQIGNRFDLIDLGYTIVGGLFSYALAEYLGVNGGVIGLVGLTGVYFRYNL